MHHCARSRFSMLPAALLAVLTAPAGATLTAPVPAFQQTGSLGIAVAADGPGAGPSITGTLNLPLIPGSASIVQAYLYAMDTNHPGGVQGSLNGAPLSGAGPYATDAAFNTLYTFRWDVTALLTPGLPSLTYALSETPDQFNQQGGQLGVVALAVVYSDASLGQGVATIIDGMTYLGNPHGETETISINGMPAGTGASAINTVTYLDDNFNGTTDSGEVVKFNGVTISSAGDLDGNLTLNGSLNAWSGTTITGADSMSIMTNTDEFGWVLTSILTPVPLPGALPLLVSALAGLAGLHGVRRRR